MRTEHDVRTGLYEEGVLHVPGRMVVSEVHRRIHVPVVLDFRSFGQCEAKARKDIYNLILHDGERMARAQRYGIGRAGQVQFVGAAVLRVHGLLQSRNFFLGFGLQVVQFHSHLFLHFGRDIPEVRHQGVQASFLAQVFDAQRFYFFKI